ncbi:hypothetical protein HOY80DRAFT_113415 [Tuber brumale]|nr:hypothetical protein HOY80DRAFT_113415 [Tuber brumale]
MILPVCGWSWVGSWGNWILPVVYILLVVLSLEVSENSSNSRPATLILFPESFENCCYSVIRWRRMVAMMLSHFDSVLLVANLGTVSVTARDRQIVPDFGTVAVDHIYVPY